MGAKIKWRHYVQLLQVIFPKKQKILYERFFVFCFFFFEHRTDKRGKCKIGGLQHQPDSSHIRSHCSRSHWKYCYFYCLMPMSYLLQDEYEWLTMPITYFCALTLVSKVNKILMERCDISPLPLPSHSYFQSIPFS